MTDELRKTIEAAIGLATGTTSAIVEDHPVGGGCINDARRIDLEDGRVFFLKFNTGNLPGLFEREAEALNALRSGGPLHVPAPIATGGAEGGVPAFLVLEYVLRGEQGPRFQEKLGQGLALLHRRSLSDKFGFDHDNYLGSTPQPNGWMEDWTDFWRERRLGFQLALARNNGLADAAFNRLGDALMDNLGYYLTHPSEPPSLLHGDLWGGNVLANAGGEPVLIDPAAYYGRREADLAMTMLFGGFSSRFYAAYEEEWPLEPDSNVRLDIYKLYHLLNHLNLFGPGYHAGCVEIMRRYA